MSDQGEAIYHRSGKNDIADHAGAAESIPTHFFAEDSHEKAFSADGGKPSGSGEAMNHGSGKNDIANHAGATEIKAHFSAENVDENPFSADGGKPSGSGEAMNHGSVKNDIAANLAGAAIEDMAKLGSAMSGYSAQSFHDIAVSADVGSGKKNFAANLAGAAVEEMIQLGGAVSENSAKGFHDIAVSVNADKPIGSGKPVYHGTGEETFATISGAAVDEMAGLGKTGSDQSAKELSDNAVGAEVNKLIGVGAAIYPRAGTNAPADLGSPTVDAISGPGGAVSDQPAKGLSDNAVSAEVRQPLANESYKPIVAGYDPNSERNAKSIRPNQS